MPRTLGSSSRTSSIFILVREVLEVILAFTSILRVMRELLLSRLMDQIL